MANIQPKIMIAAGINVNINPNISNGNGISGLTSLGKKSPKSIDNPMIRWNIGKQAVIPEIPAKT